MEQRAQCPKCGNWVPSDFGSVTYHDKCKYCAHATTYKENKGYRCTTCGLLFVWAKHKDGTSYAKKIKDRKKKKERVIPKEAFKNAVR